MRQQDLARLERELAIRLPRQYRDFMIAYPFSRSSWAGDLGTPDDVDLLLDLNREDWLSQLRLANEANAVSQGGIRKWWQFWK